MKKGKVGYLSVIKINIDFIDNTLKNSAFILSFKRNEEENITFIFGKLIPNPFAMESVFNQQNFDFDKALGFLDSEDAEGLYNYFNSLIEHPKPTQSAIDDNVPF